MFITLHFGTMLAAAMLNGTTHPVSGGQESTHAVVARAFVAEPTKTTGVELRSFARNGVKHLELVFGACAESEGRAELAEPRTVWESPFSAPAIEPVLSCATRDDGRWVVAATVHGGATRSIELWSGGPGGEPVVRTSVRDVQVAGGAQLDAKPLQLVDVFGPQVLVQGSSFVLFGSGLGDGRPAVDGFERVWCATLPEPTRPEAWSGLAGSGLVARTVADGVDPRVLMHDGRVVLAVRAARSWAQSESEAPVLLYRSQDASTWIADPTTTPISARRGYSILSWHGDLWFATPSDVDGARAEFRSYSEKTRTWSLARRSSSRLRDSNEPLWLAPSEGSLPDVLLHEGDGAWMRRRN